MTVSHLDTSTAQWCILTKVRPMIAYSNLLNKAVTHLVLNHLIPRLPVPNFLSPWTNDPHKIDPQQIRSPWTNGPRKFGPLEKWSPTNLVPLYPDPQGATACSPGQTEYSRDHLSMGTKILGTIFPWGLNWWGTV